MEPYSAPFGASGASDRKLVSTRSSAKGGEGLRLGFRAWGLGT